MTNSNSVTVYTMKQCPYCVKAKALLTQRGVQFQEVSIDPMSDQEWDDLCAKSKMKTVPQIFHGEKLIGGYTQLADLDAQDQLKNLK